MLSVIDDFYLSKEEPLKSTLMILRDCILDLDDDMAPTWKYGGPFFYYKNKMFAYLWVDKKIRHPYIGVARGLQIEHPLLEQGDRKRMKILRVDPNEDLPIQEIQKVLRMAMELYP